MGWTARLQARNCRDDPVEAGSTPPFEGGVVQNVELEEVEVYITWRQNTGARYIAT